MKTCVDRHAFLCMDASLSEGVSVYDVRFALMSTEFLMNLVLDLVEETWFILLALVSVSEYSLLTKIFLSLFFHNYSFFDTSWGDMLLH
jgi:hypothetical protein